MLLISLLVGVVNILFKSFFITDSGYWYDEICSIFYAQKDLNAIKSYATWDINPPFYHYILHYWIKVVGIGEEATRSLSLLLNGIAGGILFYFSKKYFNLKTAIIASILFFTNDILFYYAQETRSYTLDVLMVIVSNFVYFKLYEKPSWKYAFILAFVNWAAIYTHYLFAAVVMFQGIALLIYFDKKKFLWFVVSGLTTLIIFNKWLQRIYEVLLRGGNPHLAKEIGLTDLYDTITSLMNGDITVLIIAVVMIVGIYQLIKEKEYHFQFMYMFLSGFGFVLVLFILNFKSAVFIERYLIFSLVGIFISIGYMFSKIKMQRNYILYILLIIAGGLNLNFNLSKPMDYRGAAEFVKENKNDKTLILVQSSALLETFSYYYDLNTFKDNKILKIEMSKQDVFPVDDVSSIAHINLKAYEKVVMTQTFNQGADPQATVEKHLKENGLIIAKKEQKKWVNISVYENENFDEKEKTISQRYKENPDYLVELYIQKIRGVPEWMEQIKKKALKKNIPVDSMIYLDAVWYMNL